MPTGTQLQITLSLSPGEDDWLLFRQATDPKRPSLTSFFPKWGQGKCPEQFIEF
jgi:hypothetical protein